MEFLIFSFALCLCIFGAKGATASPIVKPEATTPKIVLEGNLKLCHATDEFIKILKFLRSTSEFSFHEDVSRSIAEQVSSGCDGAADRFAKVLVLLKTIGLSEKRSLEMALEFAKSAPDAQKNFIEIFTRTYLQEFFDYEYSKAMQIALELSRDYKGDARVARADFIALAKFCKDPQNLGLPISFCADYSVQVAKLSQFYPDGVAKNFVSLFKSLREKPEFVLDMKSALELTFGILKFGPRSQENFFQAFQFATSDFKLDKKKALNFAVGLAAHSFIGAQPPIMQTPASDLAGSGETPTTTAGP